MVRVVAKEFIRSSEHTAWQKKALLDILRCRTSALGGHVKVCDRCGHKVPAYNSCRNRHCPKCQSIAQGRWIHQRKERILPTHHFHLVFTLPAALRPLAKKHPKPIYELLVKAAADTLKDLAADERHLGATPAITTVLHTWTRDLRLHPHVHAIVSGGGLTDDGRWIHTPSDFLFPVLVLSRLFRGKFLAGLRRRIRSGDVIPPDTMNLVRTLRALKEIDWVVYAKRPFGGANAAFEYLGRYTHRVAISNQRLLGLSPEGVTFLTRDGATLTLSPREFVRRFLLHILPRGFTKIRHFGLLAPSAVNTRLGKARELLHESQTCPTSPGEPHEVPDLLSDPAPLCPRCKKGRLSLSVPIDPVRTKRLATTPDTS